LQTTSGLTQQWQQLLLQQAQLQLQMQLQTGNMPNANMQQQQQQHQQQQQQFPTMQVSPIPQQQAQFTMPFPQTLQPAQNVTHTQNNQPIPLQQQPAQFQLSTEDWSSRVSSQVGQAQHVPLNINPTPSPNVMHGQSQSMPCKLSFRST
jgi:hypothetical protein